MNIAKILNDSLERKASDIILTAWSFPSVKVHWNIIPLEDYWIVTHKQLNEDIKKLMSWEDYSELENNLEVDFSVDIPKIWRFRVNVFSQIKWYWIVFRVISNEVPTVESLNLSKHVQQFTNYRNWLVLVTWWVWSWKSSTLASMINTINTNLSRHIVTIEDPIEFIYKNDKSIIEQREVSKHTRSFDNWLKYALRQAADVLLVWEMRDLETFRLALRAAETWCIVFATLHTSWTVSTLSRIIDMFPWDEKHQVRQQLADSLKWIIWQVLLKNADWDWLVPATEVLVNNTAIANLIRTEGTPQIYSQIETWQEEWMITMHSYIDKLYSRWMISEKTYRNCMKYVVRKD